MRFSVRQLTLVEKCEKSETVLGKIVKWYNETKLKISLNKCHRFMLKGKRVTAATVKIEGKSTKPSGKVKYLWIQFEYKDQRDNTMYILQIERNCKSDIGTESKSPCFCL